jgi:hypothetical protein
MAFYHPRYPAWMHNSDYLHRSFIRQIPLRRLAKVHLDDAILVRLDDFLRRIGNYPDFDIHDPTIRGFDLRNNVWYIFTCPQSDLNIENSKHSSVAVLAGLIAKTLREGCLTT